MMAPRCCPRAKMQGTYCARRGIALLAASSPCWSLANRNELIYRVHTIRDLFEVPQYTRNSTVAAASRPESCHPCQAPMLHVLCFFFRFCNQSESSRDITSQPGYGRSPAKRMCIGHFSACASGSLHVHFARLLLFMSCRSRCSRAAACFLQPSHTMLCVLSFVLLDKSAGAYAALPRSLLQGPAHGYSSGRRALQPRLLHSRHTTFRA